MFLAGKLEKSPTLTCNKTIAFSVVESGIQVRKNAVCFKNMVHNS